MMGGVSPETCRASYKYGAVNFDTVLHPVGFFCMNCTMIHDKHQVHEETQLFGVSLANIICHFTDCFALLEAAQCLMLYQFGVL